MKNVIRHIPWNEKSASLIAVLVLLSVIVLSAPRAEAFLDSEDAQFQADLKEAVARARDFKRTQEAMVRAETERERYSHEAKQERAVQEEAREIERRDFVRARNNRPSEQDELDRLERLDDLEREKEAKIAEQNRRDYVNKRNRVRALLEKDAHIDEAKEYGL